MPGFGTFPFGLSPFGFGSPTGAPSPGAGYALTVDNVVARKLDVQNKDVVVDVDETGAPHEDWDPLYQQVTFRLTTPLGSLQADRDFGNEWLLLTKRAPDMLGFAERSAAAALRPLTDAREIEIVRVEVEQEGGAAAQIVTWIDRRTRRERAARVPRL